MGQQKPFTANPRYILDPLFVEYAHFSGPFTHPDKTFSTLSFSFWLQLGAAIQQF